jgi:hypothetical protein
MVRVCRLGELGRVAWITVCVLQLVVPVRVTGYACGCQMSACQR